jgi:thiol-disulfide isomerase/thioredoxin
MNRNALIALLAAVVASAALYWFMPGQGKVKTEADAVPAAEGSVSNFVKAASPADLPALTFTDAAGATHGTEVFKGKVTLLNLWATWCAPCRKEMPELAKLQREMGGADFQVVSLSEDLKGYEASAKYLKEVNADNLTLYADEKGAALDALKAPGLPVTLLLNKDGKEVGRLVGPAPWASAEAKALITAVN